MDLEKAKENYSKLGISDHFMFKKILGDEKYVKPFLETVLGFPIDHVVILDKEKEMQSHANRHAIRLDIYVDDGHTIYDCEVQNADKKNLPKRSRYYQCQIDADTLGTGTDYNRLKKTYIIFICSFDLFKQDRYVYTFKSICEENTNITLQDESIKVFLNTKGHKGNVSDEFKELMHFIDTSELREYDSEFVNDIKEALVDARQREDWRSDYMTLLEREDEIRREVREESIDKIIALSKKHNLAMEDIIADIIDAYDLSREEAEQRVRDYTP